MRLGKRSIVYRYITILSLRWRWSWINKKFSINTYVCDLATSENKSKICRAMTVSAVSAQNGVPLQLSEMTWFWYTLTAKRWTCAASKHFFAEKPSFWQTCPKVKFIVSSYFYLTKKLVILCMEPFKWNCSDRARRVVHHSSLCHMFCPSLCTMKVLGQFTYFSTGCSGDDVIVLPAIIIFFRLYIIVT